jgi:hypothetical protein
MLSLHMAELYAKLTDIEMLALDASSITRSHTIVVQATADSADTSMGF